MNAIFSHAKMIYNRSEKMRSKLSASGLPDDLVNDMAIREVNNHINEFEKILEIAKRLHDVYLDTLKEKWYFITIRPDETKCDFQTFYKTVKKFLQRKCIEEFTLSFEQKGITDDELGKGFHCHIVARTTHRSKGECLRDSKSTFSGIAAQNCIDVKTTKNPEAIIDGYLTNYESDDNHKIITKDADYKWRLKYSLKSLYTSVEDIQDIFSIKSRTEKISIIEF